MKCAYCHDELTVAATCVECQTAMHFECWEEHPTCPTLGCEVVVNQGPWAKLASLLGILLLCCSFSGKTDPVRGSGTWQCQMGAYSSPPEKVDVKTLVSKAPPDLTDSLKEFMLEIESTLTQKMEGQPFHPDTSETVEITDIIRRRVVGCKKEDEELLRRIRFMQPDPTFPGDIGGVTW